MNSEFLKSAPRYFRALPTKGSEAKVDRTGGAYGAGLIRGVSVMTRGEALGHGMWCDDVLLEQVKEHINRPNKGTKSRFTHPSLSGDGLGKYVGRFKDAEVVGDQVIADQHFAISGHQTPDGNLASYLMDLAEEDSESYGMSIVFEIDSEAQEGFSRDHVDDRGRFESPDPDNVNNYPHVRLKTLRAIDAVDEPAANPNGLFHREQNIAQEASSVAEYALGLTEATPELKSLGVDPDRTREFVTRFLNANQLEIRKMSEETKEKEVKTEPVELLSKEDTQEKQHTGQEYLDAFGDIGGVWFAQGKSFDECLAEKVKLQDEKLKSQDEIIASLQQSKSLPEETGEDNPVDFQAEEDKKKRKGFASKINIK